MVGARHGVVEERAGEVLAALVIDHAFGDGLAETLNDAAMRLPGDEGGVHQHAEIIDGVVFHQGDLAGVGIKLDLGDVTAIGEGARHAGEDELSVECGDAAIGQGDAVTHPVSEVHDADRAVRANDGEAAAAEFDIGGCCFQHMGGDVRALLDDLLRGGDDGVAGLHDGTAAARATAGDELVAVALHQTDALEGNAELIGQHLGEGGGVALAVIERAGDDGHGAVRLEAYAAHLGAGRRGDFEILADAAATNLAARGTFGLAGGKSVPIGGDQCVIEDRGEVAAVIDHGGGRGVGHLVGRDVVAATQLYLVDAHLARGGVDQALHVVVAFGAAGAAIGANGRGVGHHAARGDLDQRRAIDADGVLHRVHRRRNGGAVGEHGAKIGPAGDAQREEDAVLVQRQLGGHVMVPAMAARCGWPSRRAACRAQIYSG